MNNYNFSNTRVIMRETLEDFFTVLKSKMGIPNNEKFFIYDLKDILYDLKFSKDEMTKHSSVITILNTYDSSYRNKIIDFSSFYNVNNPNDFENFKTDVNENFKNIAYGLYIKDTPFVPNFKNFPNEWRNILTPEILFESFKNITNIYYSFENDFKIKNAACGQKVVNMRGSYSNCLNLTQAVCGPNVVEMGGAYRDCTNLTQAVCGPNVTDMFYSYANCFNLTQAAYGNKVINMIGTYSDCYILTQAVCGPNVVNMYMTYENCTNLTQAVCGPNVVDMRRAYIYCANLSQAVCGPNVVDMSETYAYCYNLTGSPVCGLNVNNMHMAYAVCSNLTGSPACGPNVINMAWTYADCYNLTGDFITFDKTFLQNMNSCFYSSSQDLPKFNNICIVNNNIDIKHLFGESASENDVRSIDHKMNILLNESYFANSNLNIFNDLGIFFNKENNASVSETFSFNLINGIFICDVNFAYYGEYANLYVINNYRTM